MNNRRTDRGDGRDRQPGLPRTPAGLWTRLAVCAVLSTAFFYVVGLASGSIAALHTGMSPGGWAALGAAVGLFLEGPRALQTVRELHRNESPAARYSGLRLASVPAGGFLIAALTAALALSLMACGWLMGGSVRSLKAFVEGATVAGAVCCTTLALALRWSLRHRRLAPIPPGVELVRFPRAWLWAVLAVPVLPLCVAAAAITEPAQGGPTTVIGIAGVFTGIAISGFLCAAIARHYERAESVRLWRAPASSGVHHFMVTSGDSWPRRDESNSKGRPR